MIVLLTACGADEAHHAIGCRNAITGLIPEPDASDVHARDRVWALLAAEDPDVRIEVEADGVLVDGESTVNGSAVAWSGALLPSSTYVATVDYVCDLVSFGFTTSGTGPPLAVEVVGQVYEVDPDSIVGTEPVQATFLASLVEHPVLVEVIAQSDAALTLRVGRGAGIQDPCLSTTDAVTTTWTDPAFNVELGELDMDTWWLHDAVLTGVFSPDGVRLQGITLTGAADVEAVAGLPERDGCNVVVAAGGECQPCETGLCVPAAFEGGRANAWPISAPLGVVASPGCE